MGFEGKEFINKKNYYKYRIESGDTLSIICTSFGYKNWRDIYNDSANDKFRKRFPNPHEIDYINSPLFYVPLREGKSGPSNDFCFLKHESMIFDGYMLNAGHGANYCDQEIHAVEDLLKIVLEDEVRVVKYLQDHENLIFNGFEFMINQQLNDTLPKVNGLLAIPPGGEDIGIQIPGYLNSIDNIRTRIIVPAFKGTGISRYLPQALSPKIPGTTFKITFNTPGTWAFEVFDPNSWRSNQGYKVNFGLDLAGSSHPVVNVLGTDSKLPHWNVRGGRMKTWSRILTDHMVIGGDTTKGYPVWRPSSRSAKSIPIAFRYIKYGQKILVIAAIASDAYDLTEAIQQDAEEGGHKHLVKTSGRVIGGWTGGIAGAWIGIKSGAAVGGMLGIETGPGAAITACIGAIIGGFIFGIGGAFGTEWVTEHAYDAAITPSRKFVGGGG